MRSLETNKHNASDIINNFARTKVVRYIMGHSDRNTGTRCSGIQGHLNNNFYAPDAFDMDHADRVCIANVAHAIFYVLHFLQNERQKQKILRTYSSNEARKEAARKEAARKEAAIYLI